MLITRGWSLQNQAKKKRWEWWIGIPRIYKEASWKFTSDVRSIKILQQINLLHRMVWPKKSSVSFPILSNRNLHQLKASYCTQNSFPVLYKNPLSPKTSRVVNPISPVKVHFKTCYHFLVYNNEVWTKISCKLPKEYENVLS